jgi:regulatory protein
VPTLTGLAPDPRQPGYRLVEVDRGRFASLPGEALDALPLPRTLGVELSAPVLARLQELADVEAACRAALRALATRGRARGDLRRRLIQKQHPPRAVDEALARLDAQGLLDDRRFAVAYAARHAARGRGPARLVADLLSQGVDRAVADAAVGEALAEEGIDPDRSLRSVAARRALQLAALAPAVRKRRLLASLARRGYRAAHVKELVEELCG